MYRSFSELVFREDIEAVVTGLPEMVTPLLQLVGTLLLDRLQDGGKRRIRWFADESVKVFRHEDIAVDTHAMALACALEDLFQDGVRVGFREVGVSLVTTEGDEVGVTVLLPSLEPGRHVRSVRGSRCRAKAHS
jgi:hypothetical protein